MALGIWGALIPLIGPYFHYAFGGDQTWHYTTQRLWLDIVPGAVAVIGGFMLLTAKTRSGGLLGGWLAVAAGAWFAIGPTVSLLWHHTSYPIGAPMGGYTRQMLEWLGYFYGLGALIIGFAAFAMGRYFSRPRVAEEPAALAAGAVAAERTHHAREVERTQARDAETTRPRRRFGLFRRRRADDAAATDTGTRTDTTARTTDSAAD